jgi:hypothetical protein
VGIAEPSAAQATFQWMASLSEIQANTVLIPYQQALHQHPASCCCEKLLFRCNPKATLLRSDAILPELRKQIEFMSS